MSNENNSDMSTNKRVGLIILMFAIIGVLFVLWIDLLYPNVENTMKVWELFLIFYVFVGSLWMIINLGFRGINKRTLKDSFVGWVIFAIMDLWIPTYAVNIDGSLISASAIGYKGTIDYCFGYYLHCFGFDGFIVWILVYFIIPIVALYMVMIIVKSEYFMQHI